VTFFVSGNNVTEGSNAEILVLRQGSIIAALSVDYVTTDSTALQRTDYTTAAGTLTFAPGESSKTIQVLITDDLYVESDEQLTLTLSNVQGGTSGLFNNTTLNIGDNDSTAPNTNPSDTASFFVRQHYHDFLSREPDAGGLGFWTDQITGVCPTGDTLCINRRRREVSDAFFFEPEFQQTGGYVFRLYRAAYGNNQPSPNPDPDQQTEARKLPSYAAFIADRAKIVAGPQLAQSQQALANALVQRAEFLARYPTSLDGPGFVDALLAAITSDSGSSLTSQRSLLVDLFNSGGRGLVLYRIADDNPLNPINNEAFINAEYRRTFVYTEYAGYLRRDADIGGFLFWLHQVNQFPVRDPSIQHTMACAFITSAEYQQRFSLVATRTNQECGQ
jgi:hypothetical protein